MKYLNDISYKDCVGKVCKSKLSGDFKDMLAEINSEINNAMLECKTGE